MAIKNVVFDLDGTIADTSLGINRAFDLAAADMGLRCLDADEREGLIGPPIKGSFMRFFGLEEGQAEKAAELFREHYSNPARLAETEIYPGIEQLLIGLRNSGLNLGVATNKRTDCARYILEHSGLRDYFIDIRGSESGSFLKKKDILENALSNMGAIPGETVLVGDTETDREAADTCGLSFIAVTYGFGYLPGASVEGAVGVVDEPGEIEALVLERASI